MSNSLELEYTVEDVYDLARDVAQEFEDVTAFINIEDLKSIIHKVISILEMLEDSVKKIVVLDNEYNELNGKYLQLLNDKAVEEDEKAHLKEVFEEMEESWIKENLFLRSIIDKLKSQNKLMEKAMKENKVESSLDKVTSYEGMIEDRDSLIFKLNAALKRKDNQVEAHAETIEKLKTNSKNLKELIDSLHYKLEAKQCLLVAKDVEKGVNEKNSDDLKQKIAFLECEFAHLKKCVSEKEECDNMSACDSEKQVTRTSEEWLKSLLQKQHSLEQKNLNLQRELTLVKEENKRNRSDPAVTVSGESRGQTSAIQTIFRLFLGVIHIQPQVW